MPSVFRQVCRAVNCVSHHGLGDGRDAANALIWEIIGHGCFPFSSGLGFTAVLQVPGGCANNAGTQAGQTMAVFASGQPLSLYLDQLRSAPRTVPPWLSFL